MADWLGNHRICYVFLVFLFVSSLWIAMGLRPVRRLSRAWRSTHPVPHGLVRRGMTAVAFGVFGLFLVAQFAAASAHLWPASTINEYLVWFIGAVVLPLGAQWMVWRLARSHLIINPMYDDEFSTQVQLPWRLLALVTVVLLSLPLTELFAFQQPLGWLMPITILAIGALWLRRHSDRTTHG